MEMTTIIGLAAGVAFIAGGILWGGGALSSFVDVPGLLIAFGGSFAALLMSYSTRDIGAFFRIFVAAFARDRVIDCQEGIRAIVGLANIARKEGLLSLEGLAPTMEDPFMEKGLNLIVDGTDPELVRGILEAEIAAMAGRHQKGAGMMESMGAFGPAFGMIGTLIGLINMLRNLSDPSAIGPGMATALVTTFYGCMMANLVFLPVANKLKLRSSDEVFYTELMLEGILSIQAGENPHIIETKLNALLPKTAEQKLPKKRGRLFHPTGE